MIRSIKEIVQVWADALRSGDYQQAIEDFYNQHDDGSCTHCCLAVALDVLNPSGFKEHQGDCSDLSDYISNIQRKRSGSGYEFTDADREIEELLSWIGTVIGERTLVQMNDSGDFDFNQIAGYLIARL